MNLLRNASIKTKLHALTAIAVSAALLLCCSAFVFKDVRTLKHAKRQLVESLASVVGANAVSAIEFDDAESAIQTLSSLAKQPSVEFAIIYDREGKVFASHPRELAAELRHELESRPLQAVQSASYLEILRPIRSTLSAAASEGIEEFLEAPPSEPAPAAHAAADIADDRPAVGHILIRANTLDIRAQVVTRILAAGLVLIVSLAAGLAISRFFRRSITDPVHELVHTARQVGQEKDYARRAQKMGEDELGMLCDAFNGMLAGLERGREQLQKAHDELERRVEERTAKLNQAVIEAQAASKAKSDFLANVSHEIRTPMTAILGFADLLNDEEDLTEEGRERIATVRRNGRHLLNIVNDVLDVSKIEAGKMLVEPRDCSVCELLADVVSLSRARAVEKGLNLEVEYIGGIPETIRTDATRFRQILVNLVGNAIKFTERGSVKIVVALSDDQPHAELPQLRVDVVDTGIGLSDKQLGNIFRAFTQADETMTRRFGGTGLGLTISQRLANLLGGNIEVSSEYGVGSTFTATIATGSLEGVRRITNCREALQEEFDRSRLSQPPADMQLSGRILLVEDGKDNQRLISFLLKKAGAEVDIAENGEAGRDLAIKAWLGENPYDLIFMDMQMPIMDGYTATKHLRDAGYELPVVALTAHAMGQERDKCIAAGCDDYLSKPVDRGRLIILANEWMKVSREQTAEQATT